MIWEETKKKSHYLLKNVEIIDTANCKWQNMNYSSQLKYKQNEVLNNLKKIGNIELPTKSKIIASENQYFYRNKMEFTFSNKRWLTSKEITSKVKIIDKNALGFHVPGMFDKVINLNNCHLQTDPSNAIRLSLKQFADKNKLTYFDIRNQRGLLRNLMIRTTSTKRFDGLNTVFESDKKSIKLLMEHLKTSFQKSLLFYTSSIKKLITRCTIKRLYATVEKIILWKKWMDFILRLEQNLSFRQIVNKQKYYIEKPKSLLKLIKMI